MSTKKRALVVAPGRGTYNKDELGYLARHHGGGGALVAAFDAERRRRGRATIAELDGAERFVMATHTRGDNASPLILACAHADFLAIDRDRFEIAAVTGNSMGWYIALGCAGALAPMAAFDVVDTMGALMQETLIGGQLIYPFVDADWREIAGRKADLLTLVEAINARPGHCLNVSIRLGGMLVFAGDEAGLKAIEAALPPVDGRFPMRLGNHAAFHTPLQAPVAERGRALLPQSLFSSPQLPAIDGRGAIWFPNACSKTALRTYTLDTQVVETYDFTRAIEVGMREFAPDAIIVLGPGTTLGGAVAQSLIGIGWQGLASKADFIARQKADPLVIAMGLPDQRPLATG